MLIELDERLPEHEQQLLAVRGFWRSIDLLAHAHRDGNHLLLATKQCCDWLLRHRDHLGRDTINLLSAMLRDARADLGALAGIRERIRVGAHRGEIRVTQFALEVPCDWFSSLNHVMNTFLIGEDILHDGGLYERLAKALAAERDFGFSVQVTGGAGYRIGLELETRMRPGGPAIAIVDTDKNGTEFGQTLKNAWKHAMAMGAICDPAPADSFRPGNAKPIGPGRLVILNAYEIENLVPREVLLRAFPHANPPDQTDPDYRWRDLKKGDVKRLLKKLADCTDLWTDNQMKEDLKAHTELRRVAEIVLAWGLAGRSTGRST